MNPRTPILSNSQWHLTPIAFYLSICLTMRGRAAIIQPHHFTVPFPAPLCQSGRRNPYRSDPGKIQVLLGKDPTSLTSDPVSHTHSVSHMFFLGTQFGSLGSLQTFTKYNLQEV